MIDANETYCLNSNAFLKTFPRFLRNANKEAIQGWENTTCELKSLEFFQQRIRISNNTRPERHNLKSSTQINAVERNFFVFKTLGHVTTCRAKYFYCFHGNYYG